MNPHTPHIHELAANEDWAALIRYWIVWQQDEAMDAALCIVQSRASRNDHPWLELAAFFTKFLIKGEETSLKGDETEKWIIRFGEMEIYTLLIILLLPDVGLCKFPDRLPLADRGRFLQHGVEKTLECAGLANHLTDFALEAHFLGVAVNGCRAAGQRETALEIAERELVIVRDLAQSSEPDIYRPRLALILSDLATLLVELGRPEKAVNHRREACAIYEKFTKTQPDAFKLLHIESLVTLALELLDLGHPDAALEHARQAYAICKELAGYSSHIITHYSAIALTALATTFRELGQRHAALEHARQACSVCEELPNVSKPIHAMALNALGATLRELGQREAALQHARQACSIWEELGEQKSDAFMLYHTFALHTLAHTLGDLGQRKAALQYAREACSISAELAKRNPYAFSSSHAGALTNFAMDLRDLGQHVEALKPAQQACVIFAELAEQNPNGFNCSFAKALHNLGRSFLELDRPEEALKPAQKACAIFAELAEQSAEAFRDVYARALHTLARTLRDLGQREDALRAAREATRLIEILGRQFPSAVAEHASMYWAHFGLLWRGCEGADVLNYSEAAAALRRARAWTATFQGTWHDPEQRRRTLEEALQLFKLSILNALDLFETSSDASARDLALADAVDAAEASRSRMLAQKLVDEELAPRNAPRELAMRFYNARRELRALISQWERESSWSDNGAIDRPIRALRVGIANEYTNESAAAARESAAAREAERDREQVQARSALAAKLEAANQNITCLLTEIHKFDPEYEADGVSAVASISDIRNALPDDTAAVSFALLQTEAVALIVTRNTLDAVRMRKFNFGTAMAWGHDWLANYFARPSRPVRAAGETEAAWTLRQRLWQAAVQEQLENWLSDIAARLGALEGPLIAPLAEALERLDQPRGKIKRLILCPSSTLHLAPLHACRIPGSRQRLGDRWTIAYTPSLSMFVRFSKRERDSAQPGLLVTNPTGDLRFTEVEAAALASHYPDARPLHRSDATREAVLEHAPNAGLFVFSGHMHFHSGEPLRGTAAVMAPANDVPVSASASKESALDGSRDMRGEQGRFVPPANWLTLADIFGQLNLTRCRLAVNNGCESALRPFFRKIEKRWEDIATENSGDGNKPQIELDVTDDAESLVTGFLFAGAPAVIGTLWAVWDISAALLMDRFHSLWRGGAGLSPGDALHAAVRWLRGDEDVEGSIRTGRYLMTKVLPEFLNHVPNTEVRADCERMAQVHSKRSPNAPPFSDPGHWAAFTANGAVF